MDRAKKTKEENSIYCIVIILITEIPLGFILGFHLTALNASTPAIRDFINESYMIRYNATHTDSRATFILTLAHSSLVWGALAGALLVKLVLNSFSGRGSLLLCHIILIISSLLMGPIAKFGNSYESLIIGRFINGMARAVCLSSGLIFISETSCRRSVGFYLSPLNTFQFVSSAVGVGVGHTKALGTSERWWWIMCIPIIVSLVYIVSWPWIIETPIYQLKSGKREEALRSLQILRRGPSQEEELEMLDSEMKMETKETNVSVLELLKIPRLRMQFFTTMIVMCSVQFSGSQAIIMYSNTLLLSTGVREEYVTFISMGIFLQCILAFLVGITLQKRYGTKIVFTLGVCIITVSYIIFITADGLHSIYPSTIYLTVVSMCVVFFGIQMGPLFVYCGLPAELTTASSRPTVIYYSQLSFWFIAGLVSLVFPYTLEAWAQFAYLPFVIIMLALVPFAIFCVPNTHEQTALQIQESFAKKAEEISKSLQCFNSA